MDASRWQGLLGVMTDRWGCRFISGLFLQARWPAGPDGFRWPAPHFSWELEAL